MNNHEIELLIVDDSEAARGGLKSLLKAIPGLELVGEAAGGKEAVRLAEALQPDVILMDLQMPDMNGLEATREIVRTSPHIAVLVLTMYDDDDSVFAAMQAGARGYLLKGATKTDMARAIRDVAAGAAIFSPAIARRMMTYFRQIRQRPTAHAFPELTPREQEVLGLLAQQYANREIAEALSLSLKTVRNYISNIFTKLQVADRAGAILKARDAGFK